MKTISEEYVEDATSLNNFGQLHQAVIDLVMSLRTINQSLLLVYLKKALVTLFFVTENVPPEEHSEYEPDDDDDINFMPFVDEETLSNVITSINNRLEILDLEIAESKDMDDSSITLFSFVNRKSTGAIRLSTKYSDNEMQLVKEVVDRIFNSKFVNNNHTDNTGTMHPDIKYTVPYMKLVKHLSSGSTSSRIESEDAIITRLSLEESEHFLQDLECYGWLERYRENYTLSTRGLVELKKFLLDTYGKSPEGTISTCFGCDDILTRGFSCSNPDCHIRFHSHCRDLVHKSKNSDDCPNADCSEKLQNYYKF